MLSSTASSSSATIAAPMTSVPITSPEASGPGPPGPIPSSTPTVPGVASSNTSPTPSHRSLPQPKPQPQHQPQPPPQPRSTPTPPPLPPPPPSQSREPHQPAAPTLPPPTVSSSPAAAPPHQQQHQQQQSHYAPHIRQLSNAPRPHHPHLPLPGPPAPYMPAAHPPAESAGAKRTASVAELAKTNTTVVSALASGVAQAPKRQALQTSTGPGPQPVPAAGTTNTRRLSLTSGLGTPISAHPHTPVSGVTMSFPPAPAEQQRQHHQHQHHQQPPYQSYQPPSLPPPPALHPVTDTELQGRSPDQLISTILSLQSQQQQYIAHISAQYDTINQQLNELRGSLQAFYNSQAASHHAAAATISPRETLSGTNAGRHVGSAGHYQSHHKRPSTSSSSRNGHNRPFIPTSPTSSTHVLPRPSSQQAAATGTPTHPHQHQQPPQQHSPGPPAYDYRTVGTVDEVWKEYKEGMDGQPAVEELDATWGSRWRPEPRGRTWYSRRKVIWDKIKEYIAEGMDENSAVREVEKLRDGGTVNKLIRSLQDERKEKGGGEDSFH